ncbi:sigma-E processing peptidase SpoIIGA [Thermosediminibacter oceani]|uniref:Sporulation sigma-E factor-processing peptidase n=1 Tax=Thermosediminibacter oceani (strain ATCC BAA-1034 / DSM 16646 / JW/IW-1228P) TaxID=555079 RepID=D9S2U5_THEOJ|nr:sigma-E processing peptidase SpoIIGA [Thermosediminibacter oceani]ADL07722.1 sigma-E processing peptidase SpoIIGA [Thermosediminibacter oceani DSM 16646]
MVIYFDVVFIINFLMNFTILWLVKLILKLDAANLRIAAGALLGNLFLLEVFFPSGALLQTIPGKIIVSIMMALIAFYPLSFSEFIKALGFFYFVSFMVGGGAFAIFYLINSEGAFTPLVNNISVPWWILLVSSLFLFVFFKFLWPFIYRILSKETLVVPVTIMFGQDQLKIKALIDTGNDLRDPITNYPVIIVEFSAIKELFPQEIRSFMVREPEEGLEEIIKAVSSSYWAARLRIIPFSSIGKSTGLMVGFKPDKVIVNFDNKVYEVRNTVLGIYHKVLSPQGTYRALLNPELLIG